LRRRKAVQTSASARTALGHISDQSPIFVISFADASARLDNDIKAKGGFVVNCNHGGGHCQSPANVKAAQWEFAKAHPFGVSPEPYAGGLPPSFPTICTIIR